MGNLFSQSKDITPTRNQPKELEQAYLDDLIGHCVNRRKPIIYPNGYEDTFMCDPWNGIVIADVSHYIGYYYDDNIEIKNQPLKELHKGWFDDGWQKVRDDNCESIFKTLIASGKVVHKNNTDR